MNGHRPKRQLREQWMRRHRIRSDRGQTALVAVVAMAVVGSIIGAVLVSTVVHSYPLYQGAAVQIYANRALEAGINAYETAVNANASLIQCTSNTNGTGLCGGINYGQWNQVPNSNASGADPEYYAFGNPQPNFDPTSHALINIAVQVVGAAGDPTAANHYVFQSETMTLSPANGFLKNVWWSNYESYNANGNYSSCNYNWATAANNPNSGTGNPAVNYNIDRGGSITCGPVYFGPADYLFGPVWTNDSVFVSGDGTSANSPSFGNPNATPAVPSQVNTADPNCLFVDDNHGMSYSNSIPPQPTSSSLGCSTASGDVALYDTANSSFGNPVEKPPAHDTQLGIIAGQNGCLYSGPTQVSLSVNSNGVGQMTVVSPDTIESTVNHNGTNYTWDNNNIASNLNNCPNNGTAPLPANGVVYVQDAQTNQAQSWANPLDDPLYNTVTNLTSNPSSPSRNNPVTLTATVTSDSNQINNGTTVAFSQTTTQFGRTQTSIINACSNVSLSSPTPVVPATSPPSYSSTATCSTTESSNGTGAFSAAYSGGNYTGASSANLGQTYTLNPSISYGPYSQVTAGGCSSCYYGQQGNPDAEGDAFVNGTLSGQLTIGTSNNVIVDGNVTYNDCSWTTGQSGSNQPSQGYCPYNASGANDTLGLIADKYVEVGRPILASSSSSGNPTIAPSCAGTPAATCDPSNGSNGITIDAAVLALNQSFVVNNYADGGTEGLLLVYGSIQQFARGPVGTFGGGGPTSGYTKHYTWNPLLDFLSPPSYLVPSTLSWVVQSINANGGNTATSVCPPLAGPYQSSTTLTQYCSSSLPTGLPNYPTTTAPDPPTVASAAVNTSNGQVTVSWTDPTGNGGSSITGYTVNPYPACSSCTGLSVSGSSATSTTMSGFTPGSNYTFTVTASNAVGTSAPSGVTNFVTIPNVPAPPTNAAAAVNANGTVTVSWTDPTNSGSPITNYTVIPSPACGGCSGTSASGATTTNTTVSGLSPGTAYTFKVTATNGIGTSNPSTASNSVTTPTVPGTPTSVTATAAQASATVTWTAPSSTGGSAITGYQVTPYIAGSAQTPQIFASTATTESVTGLANGTSYTFTVAAINGVGTGGNSAASNAVTPATVPGAPTIGTATANSFGSHSATVNFTAPASNGGSVITRYTVTATDTTWSFRGGQTATGTGSPIVVTGLTAGDHYTFKVTATNAIGTGPSSSASNQITAQ